MDDAAGLHLKLDRLLAGQEEHGRAIAGLELAVTTLAQGVQGLVPLLGTLREMLQRLLEAAGEDQAEPSELGKALAHIEAALTQQTADLGTIRVMLGRLPGQVEAAAIDGVRLAVGEGIDLPPSAG